MTIQAKKGKFPNNRQKSALIKQLVRLRSQFDLALIIERSIVSGWIGFFSPDYQPKQDRQAYAAAKVIQMQQQSKPQSLDETKPPEKPRTAEDKKAASAEVYKIMAHLKKARKW